MSVDVQQPNGQIGVRSSGQFASVLQASPEYVQLSLNYPIGLDGAVLYFDMPDMVKGNQLKSYGGYLKFKVLTGGERCVSTVQQFTYLILVPHAIVSDLSDNLPDIIISGNGYNLYNANPVIRQGSTVPVEASVRFWPRQWIKKTPGDGGEILTSLATREEIMLTLENIQHFLIR